MSAVSNREVREIDRANASGATPVVFVHGLWLLATSWDPWRRLFEDRGYATLAPGWPDEPESVEEARRHPGRFAHKKIGRTTEHFADVIRQLATPPAIVGHSFGGLIAQKLAGMGLSQATVAIDPAPFRGVVPLPWSALKAAFPVLRNPVNYKRAVALTFDQFRFAFANAVPEQEAKALYEEHAVPAPGAPLFQAAAANLAPRTEASVDHESVLRGPLLIIEGADDNTVPPVMAKAAYERQRHNPGVTELRVIDGRGHSLTIDAGWRAVAEVALGFVTEHYPPQPSRAAAEPGAPRPVARP